MAFGHGYPGSGWVVGSLAADGSPARCPLCQAVLDRQDRILTFRSPSRLAIRVLKVFGMTDLVDRYPSSDPQGIVFERRIEHSALRLGVSLGSGI